MGRPVSSKNQPQPPAAPPPLAPRRARAVRIFGTSFGLGYVPKAPGTWGTLPAVAAFLAVAIWVPQAWRTAVLGGLLALTCAAAIPLGNWAHAVLGQEDPRQFTLDEVAGFLLTVLIFHPAGPLAPDRLAAFTVWAFVLTRVMDIVKPPPARQLESLPGGWGILLDDLMASVYAGIALYVVYWLLPSVFLELKL
jgi:phosphatidylglycerophosphatase A